MDCTHKGCGGCQYLGVPYEEQLALKDSQVRDYLEIAGIECDEYLGIEGSPVLTGYRNKMDYTFGDEFKGGPITLGMHKQKNFMSVITTDHCGLVHEDFNIILAAVLNFAAENGYSAYNKKSHRGLLRNLILRRGVRTGKILVNIVTSGESAFDEEGFAARIRSLELSNEICGILRTLNDNVADFTYSDELRVLEGEDFYREVVRGLHFKVNAFSFFQTNVEAVERLYDRAISWISSLEDKTVFDLYCGAGTISQIMAAKAAHVTGVELSQEAVRDARANAELNGILNCSFVQGDVLEVIDSIKGGGSNQGLAGAMFERGQSPAIVTREPSDGAFVPAHLSARPDIVVLDPPRAGVRPKALAKILELGAKEMVYISCNPKSFSENLRSMQYFYRIRRVQAFDNFPFTRHIEATALLELK